MTDSYLWQTLCWLRVDFELESPINWTIQVKVWLLLLKIEIHKKIDLHFMHCTTISCTNTLLKKKKNSGSAKVFIIQSYFVSNTVCRTAYNANCEKLSVKMFTLFENCITKMYELILIGFIIKWCHRVVDSEHYYNIVLSFASWMQMIQSDVQQNVYFNTIFHILLW